MNVYLPVEQIAELCGLSRQAVAQIVAKAFQGQRGQWRGASLIVRQVRGRGGRSGMRYEVRLASLPADLQEAWKALQSPIERRSSHGESAIRAREFWYHLIGPVLPLEKHSRERGAALAEIASRHHYGPDCKPRTVAVRTLQRKIDAYEAFGMAGLSRKKRLDAGQKRTILSRAWDKAVSFDDATRERLAHELRQYVRGLIKAGEVPSVIMLLAQDHLAQLTRKAGWTGDDDALAKACRIPANLIEAERPFGNVYRFNRDRKAHEDNKPRIQRTAVGLRPMEIVFGDVHPIDIVLRRDDGSTAHARAIGWLDFATNRLWLDLVLFESGKGVTNAHVVQSFINMVSAWGAPETLYLDNGNEYNWAEFIDDALKLIQHGNGGPRLDIALWNRRASNIVRARAYNASAKPIENSFKQQELLWQVIPGWIGGDRMKSKSANVGRPPEPFPGSFDDFKAIVDATLEIYHRKEQKRRGRDAKVSPNQLYAEAVKGGWQPTMIDADALHVAFSTPKELTVRQGRVQFDNRFWTCDELMQFQGRKVTALLPKWDDWSCLPILTEGETWFARPDRYHDALDPAGAKEASRRSNLAKNAVRQLNRSAPDVDPLAERAAFLSRQPELPAASIAGVVTYSERASEIAHKLRETPQERRDREIEEQRRLVRKREELGALVLAAYGRKS